jgi:hypothetical protein
MNYIELFLHDSPSSPTHQQMEVLNLARLALQLRTVLRMYTGDRLTQEAVIKYLADRPERSWMRDFADLGFLCKKWEQSYVGKEPGADTLADEWFKAYMNNESHLKQIYAELFPRSVIGRSFLPVTYCESLMTAKKTSRFGVIH